MVETKITLSSDNTMLKTSLLYKMPLVFLAGGIAALIFWSTFLEVDRARSMYSYLFGFTVVLSLGLGALSFVLIQHLTRAGWSVLIRRLPEAFIVLMPLFIIFFLPIAIFAHDIFPWTHAEHMDAILEQKAPYLNEQFFLIRSFGYLLVWSVLGVWFYSVSVAQDNGARFKLTKNLQALSAPGVILFGLTLTFASVDWLMSLEPHWYSTIYGVYFFAGCHLFGLAFITLMTMLLQSAGLLPEVSGEHYHDLGKLLFGFTVFWAYIGFSQFMLYWYGAVPEEVEFYAHRLHHGWEVISWAMPISHFFLPFFALMSRSLKRVKLFLAINCLWVIAVHIVDIYWLILPAFHDASSPEGTHLQVLLPDLLSVAGIFSIFFGAFLFVLSRRKIVAVGDPRLSESLAFENF